MGHTHQVLTDTHGYLMTALNREMSFLSRAVTVSISAFSPTRRPVIFGHSSYCHTKSTSLALTRTPSSSRLHRSIHNATGMTMASIDYGYGEASPEEDYGYGKAEPSADDYGYGDAAPEADYGYGDAAPAEDYGYGDAAPAEDMGYGDAKPDVDMGYGSSDDGMGYGTSDDEGMGGPRSAPKRRGQVKRRCSVTKYSLVSGEGEGGAAQPPPAHFDGDRLAMLQHLAGPPPGATTAAPKKEPEPEPEEEVVRDPCHDDSSSNYLDHSQEIKAKPHRESKRGTDRHRSSVSDDGMENVYDHAARGGQAAAADGDHKEHHRRKGGLRSKMAKMRKRLSVAF